MELSWGHLGAHLGACLGPSAILGPSRGHLGAVTGVKKTTRAGADRLVCSSFFVNLVGPSWSSLGAIVGPILGPSGACLGPSAILGPSRGHDWGQKKKSEQTGSLLEFFCEPRGALLELSWRHLGAHLGTLWGLLGPSALKGNGPNSKSLLQSGIIYYGGHSIVKSSRSINNTNLY